MGDRADTETASAGSLCPSTALLLLACLVGAPAVGQGGAPGGEVLLETYYIDRYEYPNAEGILPRVNVTWTEAQALCRARGKRLCTELEWEHACAGPGRLAYGYGNEFEAGRCNTPVPAAGTWRRGSSTAPSGTHPSCGNDNGVRDLIGNVWEWTDGWYDEARGWRAVRGGSWFNSANMARSEARYGRYLTQTYHLDLVGFRCCRSIADTAPDRGQSPLESTP